ncbi:MAG: proteasome subunit beta [Candidatus Micrarchaeia archaeon]
MDFGEAAKKVMKGTTTVGIVCQDGIVMGADSRASMDTFIASSEAIKVYKIDETLGVTIAGSVGFAEYIVKFLKVQNELYKMDEGKPLSPSAASSLLSLALQENANPYLLELNLIQLIVGGLHNGTPELYDIDPLGGAIKESRITSTGSGSLTALGYLESVYAPDLSTEDAVKHAIKALKIAMKRDSATGDNMKIVAITKKGFKEYTKEELEKLAK